MKPAHPLWLYFFLILKMLGFVKRFILLRILKFNLNSFCYILFTLSNCSVVPKAHGLLHCN